MKYVDDLSLAQAIDLRKCLVPNPNPTKPQAYHDRTDHILPSSKYTLQDDLNQLVQYSENHGMKINEKKCKVMIFNTAKKYDGLPTLTLPGKSGSSCHNPNRKHTRTKFRIARA